MSETMDAAAPEAGTVDDDLRDNAAPAPVATQDDGAEAPEGQEQTETEEIDEIELSFGAKKLKVPRGSIPEPALAALTEMSDGMNADYTRKTQEIAEQRKAAEAERELLSKLSTLKGDALRSFAAGQNLAAEIAQLEQIDLSAVWQSDPDQARRIGDTLSIKRAEFQKHVNAVSHHEAAMEAEQQRVSAKLEEAGRAEMSRLVKGFDAKAEQELVEYAVKSGIPESNARRWHNDPKTAALAWKAMQFDKLQAQSKAATAPKAATPPAAPVKPVAGTRAAAQTPDWEKMSAEEFARRRNELERKRKMAASHR